MTYHSLEKKMGMQEREKRKK